MSFVSKAKAAFYAGDYAQAIALYEQAIIERPELARTYRFNLNLARAKLGMQPIQEDVMPSISSALAPPSHSSALAHLSDLFLEVEEAARRMPIFNIMQQPLVSVVMTAHNAADYIEEAVTSIMRQTHGKLELIVVDDASTDDTWEILQRLRKTDNRLRCRRLNTNLGTYFARNFGLTLAHGEYVFFQNGDDICHPERIRLCLHALQGHRVVCVRACYSSVRFPEGVVLPVNGLVKRPGLITLGVRRSIFDEIGFFNATAKASDDEFFQRLMMYCQHHGWQICDLDLPLYYNTLRASSLFEGMISNESEAEQIIDQVSSPFCVAYEEAFSRLHKELAISQFKSFFRFPVIRDLIPVAPDMTCLENPKLPVVLAICSIPKRERALQMTLQSLAPQVDEIHLYLDRYTKIPAFVLSCHPKITVVRSNEIPGLRDNGKFLPFNQLDHPCYYFTADDDIIYPPDYVQAIIRKIEYYGRRLVVGVHGVLVPERPRNYFSDFRKVYLFNMALERDVLVSNLGTGTVAFYSECLRGLDYRQFAHPGMVDLYLAIFCKQQYIPMVAIARHENWLVEQESLSTSLYEEFRQAGDQQAVLVKNYAPWGYSAIQSAVEAVTSDSASNEASERLRQLVPVLQACLW
jgi:glycosyltransferase involved in cell wall biosynthesis